MEVKGENDQWEHDDLFVEKRWHYALFGRQGWSNEKSSTKVVQEIFKRILLPINLLVTLTFIMEVLSIIA